MQKTLKKPPKRCLEIFQRATKNLINLSRRTRTIIFHRQLMVSASHLDIVVEANYEYSMTHDKGVLEPIIKP